MKTSGDQLRHCVLTGMATEKGNRHVAKQRNLAHIFLQNRLEKTEFWATWKVELREGRGGFTLPSVCQVLNCHSCTRTIPVNCWVWVKDVGVGAGCRCGCRYWVCGYTFGVGMTWMKGQRSGGDVAFLREWVEGRGASGCGCECRTG